MARLHIIYDPDDRIITQPVDQDMYSKFDIKTATLSIKDDLHSHDIYSLARRLSEMLLEQLS